jgi:hypothetical protein
MSVKSDMEFGEFFEYKFNELNNNRFKKKAGKFPYYDLYDSIIKVEVKAENDDKEKNWTNTGNAFIEHTGNTGQDSGINITTSDYWVHFFAHSDYSYSFYMVFKTDELVDFVKKYNIADDVGGLEGSKGYLVKIQDLKKISTKIKKGNNMLKIGLSGLTGRVSGIWNKENKAFEVKRGMSKNDKKYQIFEISVSSKDQQDNWTNGKGIKVMMFGDTKVEHGDTVGLVGRFQPDNWENKEGKTVYGNIFMCNAEDMFEPEQWDKKEDSKPNKKEEDEESNW